jgi:hypothetical protein
LFQRYFFLSDNIILLSRADCNRKLCQPEDEFLSCCFQGLVYLVIFFFFIFFKKKRVLSVHKFILFWIWQAVALAFYVLSALFVSSFVIIFVVIVLLAALDFWVVKNVGGCILVGLRWWNEINDLGESVWKFESLDQEVSITSYAFQYQLIFTRSHHHLLVVMILINLSSLGLITLCLG